MEVDSISDLQITNPLFVRRAYKQLSNLYAIAGQ